MCALGRAWVRGRAALPPGWLAGQARSLCACPPGIKYPAGRMHGLPLSLAWIGVKS